MLIFSSISVVVLPITYPFIVNFISEEYDRLIKVLNSRVIKWSVEAGERSSVVSSPRNKLDLGISFYKFMNLFL